MSFPVATFEDLMAQVAADFTALPGADVTLRFGVVAVLTKIFAKLSAGELLYLAALPNRALIPTKMNAPYLDIFCGGVGLKRLAAAPAAGSVTFTGTPGIPIPVGTQLQNSTATVTVETTTAGEIASGNTTVTLPVEAVTGGSAGNLATAAPMTLLVGIAGIYANAVVASPGLTGGTDEETDAALQVRLGERLSNPPQGGANGDYVGWAKQVSGVTRVWVYPATPAAGQVTVMFMMDGRASPIPLSADVAAVSSAIAPVRPVTVNGVVVTAPAAMTEAVTIGSLTAAIGYTLAQAQAAATAAIAALNYTTTPGGYGWDGQAENYLTGGTLLLEQISTAIANAAGVGTFDLTSPSGDVTATFGNIVQLAAPTFT